MTAAVVVFLIFALPAGIALFLGRAGKPTARMQPKPTPKNTKTPGGH